MTSLRSVVLSELIIHLFLSDIFVTTMDDQSNPTKGYYTNDRTTKETNNVEEIISSTWNSLTAHSGPLVAQFNLDYANAVCANVLKSLQFRATTQENSTMMLPLPSSKAEQGCIDAVALPLKNSSRINPWAFLSWFHLLMAQTTQIFMVLFRHQVLLLRIHR